MSTIGAYWNKDTAAGAAVCMQFDSNTDYEGMRATLFNCLNGARQHFSNDPELFKEVLIEQIEEVCPKVNQRTATEDECRVFLVNVFVLEELGIIKSTEFTGMLFMKDVAPGLIAYSRKDW